MPWFWKTWGLRTNEGTQIQIRLPRAWYRVNEGLGRPWAFRNDRDKTMIQITVFTREAAAHMHGRLQELVLKRARELAPEAVRSKVDVFGFRGDSLEGWYNIASDRNLKPGDWGHMLHGLVEIEGVVMAFTFLSHTRPTMGEGAIFDAFKFMTIAGHSR